MDKKTSNITIVTFTFLGIICIASGFILPSFIRDPEVVRFSITQNPGALAMDENIIINLELKDLTFEIGEYIPTDLSYFLYNFEDLSIATLDTLILNTSNVNTSLPGVYTYTITLDARIFTGNITIRDSQRPRFDISLKNLNLPLGSLLPTNLEDFIIGYIPYESRPYIRLDLTRVNMNVAGIYQYTVTYHNRMFTGNITVFEPQPPLQAPGNGNGNSNGNNNDPGYDYNDEDVN